MKGFYKKLLAKLYSIAQSLLKNPWIKKTLSAPYMIKRIVLKLPFAKQAVKYISKVQTLAERNPLMGKLFAPIKKTRLFFLSAALFLSLIIFYFMSVLISTGKAPQSSASENVSIDFLLNKTIDELELRSRRLPKKVEAKEPPPETPKVNVQQTELQKPELSSALPQLELPNDFQSDSKGASVSGQGVRDRAVTPVFRMNPMYPRKAALQGVEGFVILKFDITETGEVDNISVIQASPPQIFNSSAVQALRKWKYKPRVESGKAVRQRGLKVQLDFRLNNE